VPESTAEDEARLHFKVSSALKNLIGRDLITDDFVAIFELVKNSFDAHARRVDLVFEDDAIFVVDDGKGMELEDLIEKWFFVAYSAKKEGTEDKGLPEDYRHALKAKRSSFAGNKGVGRFSCDRLGRTLKLQTRSVVFGSRVEAVEVEWDRFEADAKEEFADVELRHFSSSEFELPGRHQKLAPRNGTVLEIGGLRSDWDRKKLLRLRQALAKLVDPFGTAEGFQVFVHAPSEEKQDRSARQVVGLENESPYREVVNGEVKNLVFETLAVKTTKVSCRLAKDGNKIDTELIDRGELVYKIRERNSYDELRECDVRVTLYFLNRRAKYNFARQMGIDAVNFGNVFLFNHGFRVFPIGERGDDTFGLDTRKQQGFARYLGTRDVLGRVDVEGPPEKFKESTSRDQGLIRTRASIQLKDFFMKKAFARLEQYVVGVSWQDKLDQDEESTARMETDSARSRIVRIVSGLARGKDVEILDYSDRLVNIVDEKSSQFEVTLDHLKALARQTGNTELAARAQRAEKRFAELKEAEAEARLRAEQEREAREKAERRAKLEADQRARAEAREVAVQRAYEEEKKRNLFLASISTLDQETVVNLHHQIIIYSAAIHQLVEGYFDKRRHGEIVSDEDVSDLLETVRFKNQQVLAVSRLATKANFRLDSEQIEADLVAYLRQYAETVCSLYASRVRVVTEVTDVDYVIRFKPIEMSMIVDNLVSNAEKAAATEIRFRFEKSDREFLIVEVTDDGVGLDDGVVEPSRVFEKGFSTTDGSGLGLYHVRQILDEMGASISLDSATEEGSRFVLRFTR
jgi:signal transduction histidine kinase